MYKAILEKHVTLYVQVEWNSLFWLLLCSPVMWLLLLCGTQLNDYRIFCFVFVYQPLSFDWTHITKNLYTSSTLIQIVLKIYQASWPRNSESDLMKGADIHTVFKALQVILTHGQEREPGSSLFGLIPGSLFDTAYRTVWSLYLKACRLAIFQLILELQFTVQWCSLTYQDKKLQTTGLKPPFYLIWHH